MEIGGLWLGTPITLLINVRLEGRTSHHIHTLLFDGPHEALHKQGQYKKVDKIIINVSLW